MMELPLLLIVGAALVVWALYGERLRKSFAGSRQSPARVSRALLIPECVLFGVLVARAPFFRTLPGLALAVPMFLGLHAWVSSRSLRFLRSRGLLAPAKPPPESGLPALFARHFYISLTIAYALILGTIFVLRMWTRG